MNERFRIMRELGRGAMGTVHLAFDSLLGRPVAIKRLRREYARDLEFAHRFMREARVSARLRHPAIVAVHDFGRDDDGVWFLVMEYVDGAPLEELLRAGPLGDAAALALLTPLAEGLAHAHAAGVLHRDLKPANILCEGGRTERPRIGDFGLAKVVADGHVTLELTRRGAVLGTPAYMAPEQASGEDPVLASDVYAWGCIAYHALTGRPPFSGLPGEVVRAQVYVQPPPPSSAAGRAIDPDSERLVMRALAKPPGERFADGAALVAAMHGLGASGGAGARAHVVPTAAAEPREPLHQLAAAIVAGHSAPAVAAALAALAQAADQLAAAESDLALLGHAGAALSRRMAALGAALADLSFQRARLDDGWPLADAASATLPAADSDSVARAGLEQAAATLRRRLAEVEREQVDHDGQAASRHAEVDAECRRQLASVAGARQALADQVDTWLADRPVPPDLTAAVAAYRSALQLRR